MQQLSTIYRYDIDACSPAKIDMVFMLNDNFTIPKEDQVLVLYYSCIATVKQNWPEIKVISPFLLWYYKEFSLFLTYLLTDYLLLLIIIY